MSPEKYQQNRYSDSAEEIVLILFIIYGQGGHLEFRIMTILAIFVPPNPECSKKSVSTQPSSFGEKVVW